MIAFDGVIINHIEDHLEAGGVKSSHHRLELGHLLAHLATAGILTMWRKKSDRVVAPIINQAALNQPFVIDMGVDRQEFHRSDPEILQVSDRRFAPQAGIGAAQLLRNIRPKLCETFYMHLVNHRLSQRRSRLAVVAPIKCIVDHDRLGHAPGVVAKILREILLLVAHDVGKHFVSPIHAARDRFRVRIDQYLGVVETQAPLRIVRTRNAIAIELTGARVRKKHMPDMLSALGDWNSNIFLWRIDSIEQAKIDPGRVFGKKSEVHAASRPSCTQRIRVPEPSLYRSHKLRIASILQRVSLGNSETRYALPRTRSTKDTTFRRLRQPPSLCTLCP